MTSRWQSITIRRRADVPLIFRHGDFTAPEALYPAETTSAAFDPEHPGTIYLGVYVEQGKGSGHFIVGSMDDGATWTTVAQFDRPVYGLAVSAGGVLHAAQTPDPPEAYLLTAEASGEIRYGTYLGGALTQVNSVMGSGGQVFIAGHTQGGLPLANAAQPGLGGGADGFVAVFDDSGELLWSTYLGGGADDSIDWVLPPAGRLRGGCGDHAIGRFPDAATIASGWGNDVHRSTTPLTCDHVRMKFCVFLLLAAAEAGQPPLLFREDFKGDSRRHSHHAGSPDQIRTCL